MTIPDANTAAPVRSRRARIGAAARQGAQGLASVWAAFVQWFNAQEFSENSVLLAFAVAIGIAAALGVVAFYKSIDFAFDIFYKWPGLYLPHLSFLLVRPLVTALGLMVAWWIMHRLGQDSEGMNVPDVQLAVVKRGGYIPSGPAVARTAASAVTIGSGGSAGSEGPVVVLGAAIGSWLGRAFRFEASRVRLLVGCATGAAISAAFNAPLAGAFFALEETVGTIGGFSFAPVVVASVVSALVSRAVFGNHPAFAIPKEYGYGKLAEVTVFFPLLGVVAGMMAAFYVRMNFRLGEWTSRMKLSRPMIAAIGGALVGGVVFLSPNGMLVGYGHLALRADVFGRMAWYALLALAVGKVVATTITLNFGGSGGVFTPSLYIGAATGGALGSALDALFPHMGLHPEAYALVGMGAMIAGATDAPITGILLVFEMTNDYAIVLPLMLTVVICHAVSRRIEPDSLYSGWLRRRGESLEHGTDRDVLAGLHVSDAFRSDVVVLPETASVTAFLEGLHGADQGYFPVVDDAQQLVGVATIGALSAVAANARELGTLVLASDVAEPTETVTPSDSLRDAVRRMGVRGAAAVPVVDAADGRYLGLLTRSQVLSVYERSMSEASAARH
ncbi:MAG TPA: chloride channel protein [Gemmatimonadaceae bacterium]|nr:chloride channel protein [Gemmatimonadaceae bacterium]